MVGPENTKFTGYTNGSGPDTIWSNRLDAVGLKRFLYYLGTLFVRCPSKWAWRKYPLISGRMMPQDGKLDIDFRNALSLAKPFNPKPSTPASLFSSTFNSHKKINYPLFGKTPELQDVTQQAIGDCWFLAALIAILNAPGGANQIEGMMRLVNGADGDQKVIVRLYDIDKIRHYFLFDMSIIDQLGKSGEGHAKITSQIGLWPAILEKALTAFDKSGKVELLNADYSRIDGGNSDRAFRHILGCDVSRIAIVAPAVELRKQINSPSGSYEAFVRLLCGMLDRNADSVILNGIFNGSASL